MFVFAPDSSRDADSSLASFSPINPSTSPNSTQPQRPVITAHKIPANDTHQSQWQIISPPYHNNTLTTKNMLITIITQDSEKDKKLISQLQILNYPTNCTRTQTEFWLLFSEDAGHRDWRNVRKNNIQNTAKEPEKPTTTIRSRPWKLSRIQCENSWKVKESFTPPLKHTTWCSLENE